MNNKYYKLPCKKYILDTRNTKYYKLPYKKYIVFNDSIDFAKFNNLTDITLNSFEDIVWLSYKSLGKLGPYFSFDDKKILSKFIKEEYIQPILENCSKNYLKLFLIYKTLNKEQKDVFLDIHNKMSSSSNSIMCIDTGPGTGKTFIIASLAITCKIIPCYLVYTRKLEQQLSKICNLYTYTNCKFFMDSLNLSFFQQLAIWSSKSNGSYMNMIEKYYEVLCLANRIKLPTESNLYILDEYSVVSPMFIFLLYCLSIRWDLHILFVGDRFQQSSLNKSIFHSAGNFVLIQSLYSKQYLLNKRIRQSDDIVFQEKLQLVTQLLQENYNGNETSMNFALKYSLYQIFKHHFSLAECFSSVYLAQYHMKIKKRMLRYQNKLEKGTFRLAYVCTKSKEKKSKTDTFVELREGWTSSKFLPYLVLVTGQYYNYIVNSMNQIVVEYLGMLGEDSNKLVLVQDIKNRDIFYSVKPKIISRETMHTEQIKWLKGCTNLSLYQYPLLARTFTYHAAQGITIHEDMVELNMDTATLNSFYVGLTRLKTLSQLGKIHSKDLYNLVITDLFNDDYYYKISSYTKLQITRLCNQNTTKIFSEFLKTIKFRETRYLSTFNRSERFVNYKISRNIFNYTIKQRQNQSNSSRLVNLAKFIRGSDITKQLAMFEFSQEYLLEYLKDLQ